jgi:3'(2'), 5'-bisphosphate nucleotidase
MEFSLEDSIALCRKAGDAARALQGNVQKTTKADGSPVTNADKVSNEILQSGLQRYGIPVLSEETQASFVEHGSGRTWIIDPVDGTSGFVEGSPEWAVMLALLEDGVPLFAVVYAPVLGMLWSAERGKGAFRQTHAGRERITVSRQQDPHEARILLSKHHNSKEAQTVAKILGSRVTQMGCMGLKVCRIAEGSAELYWTEAHIGEWDVCAPQLILEEAGGKMTDAKGDPFLYGSAQERHVPGVAAANKALHAVLVEAARTVQKEFAPRHG